MTNIDQKMESMQKQMELIQKQMESLQQENIDLLEFLERENRLGMESFRLDNQVKMEFIASDLKRWMNNIKLTIRDLPIQFKLKEGSGFVDAAPGVRNGEQHALQLTEDQPIQFQLKEGSGFVDAAPGVRNGEERALQLTEGSELVESEEYINVKSYAYFYGRQGGLFRVKIPSSRNQDIKIEHVILNDPTNPNPKCMALFSHYHNHNIYMVRSQIRRKIEYGDGVNVFDPNRFKKLPIQGLGLLDQPKELRDSFKPMIKPSWIQSEGQIYLISGCNYDCVQLFPFFFQTFDLTKNHFITLEPPPFEYCAGDVVGFFSLCGYIYLFIEKLTEDMGHYAFRFNPRSSKWKELTLHHFEQEKIPIPSSRVGDVGLSQKFPSKSQILVTLNVEGPAAYCIQFCDDGSLRPNSYRRLDEIFIHKKYKTEGDYAYLHNIGRGRFCVVYRSRNMPLLIYVFKINFEVELHIQSSNFIKSNQFSSQVIYSKKCEDPIPLWDLHFFGTLLPSSASNEGLDMAATSSEDKDLKKKSNCKSRRRRSRRKKIQQ